jgi:hypothetical protein
MCSFSRAFPTPATDARQVANYDCSSQLAADNTVALFDGDMDD